MKLTSTIALAVGFFLGTANRLVSPPPLVIVTTPPPPPITGSSERDCEIVQGIVRERDNGIIPNLNDRAFVQLMYRILLRREPEPEGLSFKVGELESGQATRDATIRAMLASEEFRLRTRTGAW